MEDAELTRLGFRKGLDKEHRDYELLARLEEAIIRHAKGWERFAVDIPALLRQSIDEVIDAPRSRRFVVDELEKTEKTYLGTKVEILLRNHLDIDRGEVLDVRVDGIEVDIKNTIKSSWMIPREAVGHPCILISTDEKRAKCSFGLVVIEKDILTRGKNQDGKGSISAEGKKNIHWMLKDKDYPRNFWEGVTPAALKKITAPRGGTERLALLFEHYQQVPIPRDVLLALAHQKDAMKRLRKNGGARDRLAREGIGLLSGKYNSALIAKLGLPFCGVDDFISVKPSEAEDVELLRADELI
jgi:hypothetical protein